MDPLRAVALPGQCGIQRGAVLGLAAGLALHQAHGLTSSDVVDTGLALQCRAAADLMREPVYWDEQAKVWARRPSRTPRPMSAI